MDNDIVPTKHQSQPAGHQMGRQAKMNNKRLMLCALIVVAVAAAVVWSWFLFGRNTNYDENKGINHGEYQAVFLTNGQVYFGKLADLNHKYVTLTDIFYLQVQSSDGKSLQNASNSTDTGAQVSLAKLGSELHGPEDKMHISSDQVLFWENLTNDGKVAQAITAYQKK